MASSRFEKVTTQDHTGCKRTLRLEVTGETSQWLTGFEVDREGSRKEPSAKALRAEGAETGEILHLIDTGTILRREPLSVSLTYGWLVDSQGRDA